MKLGRSSHPEISIRTVNPELIVIEFISTHRGDPERGPLVRISNEEARLRLVSDGELVRVTGPRRQELAVLVVDDAIPPRHVSVRDVAGISITETLQVAKLDLDSPPRHVG